MLWAPAYSILPFSSTRTREFSTGSAPVPSMSLPPTIAYFLPMLFLLIGTMDWLVAPDRAGYVRGRACRKRGETRRICRDGTRSSVHFVPWWGRRRGALPWGSVWTPGMRRARRVVRPPTKGFRYFLARALVANMRIRPTTSQPSTMDHSTMLREAGLKGRTSRPMMMAPARMARRIPNLPPGTL